MEKPTTAPPMANCSRSRPDWLTARTMAMPTPIAMEMRTCLSSTRQILRNAARSIQLSYTARTTLCSPESFHDVIDRRFGPHFHSFPSGEVFEALDQHDVRLEVR